VHARNVFKKKKERVVWWWDSRMASKCCCSRWEIWNIIRLKIRSMLFSLFSLFLCLKI
jgi:hypothetical protein